MAALSSLYVELVSTAKGFSVGFEQASKDVNAFKQQTESLNTVLGKESAAAAQTTAMNMGLVASAVVGAVATVGTTLISMANHTAEFGEKLTDMAGRTGISVEELQKLGFAAAQSGSTIDAFANGLERISRVAYQAASGTGEGAAVFNALGISVKDASGNLKSASDLTLEVADRFQNMQDGVGKTALAMALFGRSGADLVPTLNLGSEGLREMGAELESVGGVMSGAAAQAGDIYRDKLNLLSQAMRGAGDQVGLYLIPKLIGLLDVITPLIRPTVTFVDTLLKLGTGNFLGALKNLRPPTAEEMELEKTRQAFLAFRTAAIESAEAQKLPAPIIDKHREAREKLSDAQKAANRIMEQERDEINKQGIALMNAEAAWMQYNDTMANMPSERVLGQLQVINDIIEKNESILQNSPLSTGRIPLAGFPMPIDFGQIPTADPNGPFKADPAAIKKQWDEWKKSGQQAIDQVINDMSRMFVDSITHGKNFWEAFKSFGTNAIAGLMDTLVTKILHSFFDPFATAFGKLLDGMTSGLTGVLSGLGAKLAGAIGLGGGGATSAVAGATGTATTIANSVTESAAGAAGGLASGLISAAGGIIGGGLAALGSMRLEGTMNAVEYNTRATMIHSQVMIDSFFAPWTSIFEWSLNWAHESAMILDAIYNLMVAGGGVGGAPIAAGGVTNNITFNITSPAAAKASVEYLDEVITTGRWGYREKWTMIFNQNAGVISTVPAG